MLTIRYSTAPTDITVVRGSGLISDDFAGVGLARSRALVPVVSGVLGTAGVDVNSVSNFTVDDNPNSFAKMEVNVDTIGNLTVTGGAGYINISALHTVTRGCSSASYVIYTIVSTHYGRLCGTVFSVRGNGVAHLGRSHTLVYSALLRRVGKLSRGKGAIVVMNSNTSVFCSGTGRVAGIGGTRPVERCRGTTNMNFTDLRTFGGNRTVSPGRLLPFCLELPRTRHRLGLGRGGW